LSFRAEGRYIIEGSKGYQLREGSAPYNALLRVKNGESGLENIYFLKAYAE
jgi:hypothetical protein